MKCKFLAMPLDQVADRGTPQSKESRLIIHVVTFEVSRLKTVHYVLSGEKTHLEIFHRIEVWWLNSTEKLATLPKKGTEGPKLLLVINWKLHTCFRLDDQ